MCDSREEIPQWVWYTGQFLFQFDKHLREKPKQTISDFFDTFLKNQELKKNIYHTKNQGTIILLLYGLLVIPKEIWKNTAINFQFTTRSNFKVKISPPKKDCNPFDTSCFLQLLRNSLAHANFSVDASKGQFTFWNNKNRTKNFEVEINYDHIGEFIAEVGKYYINEVKNKKR